MHNQLILQDSTLASLCAILPYGQICAEIARARDRMSGGRVSRADVVEIERALAKTETDPGCPLTRDALKLVLHDWRHALRNVDFDQMELAHCHQAPVFVWDPARDSVSDVAATRAAL